MAAKAPRPFIQRRRGMGSFSELPWGSPHWLLLGFHVGAIMATAVTHAAAAGPARLRPALEPPRRSAAGSFAGSCCRLRVPQPEAGAARGGAARQPAALLRSLLTLRSAPAAEGAAQDHAAPPGCGSAVADASAADAGAACTLAGALDPLEDQAPHLWRASVPGCQLHFAGRHVWCRPGSVHVHRHRLPRLVGTRRRLPSRPAAARVQGCCLCRTSPFSSAAAPAPEPSAPPHVRPRARVLFVSFLTILPGTPFPSRRCSL